MRINSSVTGLDEVIAKTEKIAAVKPILVKMETSATQGWVYRKRVKGWVTQNRSAGDNMIALRDNAKKGRQVVFYTPADRAEGRKIFKSALKDFTANPTSTMGLISAGRDLGKKILEISKKHFKDGDAAGGMKRITAYTLKRKLREIGPGKQLPPPMTRTGQLANSLFTSAEEIV